MNLKIGDKIEVSVTYPSPRTYIVGLKNVEGLEIAREMIRNGSAKKYEGE